MTASAVLPLLGCGGGAPLPPPGTDLCLRVPTEVTLADAGSGSSEWNDVMIDGRGRVWLAGYERGTVGRSTLDPSGDARALVQVRAADGAVLHERLGGFDSPGTDVAEALAMDAGGTVYVAGRTTGVLAGSVNRGQFDSFVARGDAADPDAAWQLAQFGNERPQHPRRLLVHGGGDLYLAGYDDDHIPTNHVAAWADAFVARLRAADAPVGAPLAPLWSRQDDSLEQDYASALAVGAGGEVYLGGLVSAGVRRGMYVRKLHPDGSEAWRQRYSAGGADNVAALIDLGDGTLLMGGSVFGPFRGGTDQGAQDVFVARLRAADGAVLWSAQRGTAAADWLTDARIDARGNILLYGETEGSFVRDRPSAGDNDLFLLKLRPDGTLLRAWQWGSAGDERASTLALDGCGRALAVGSVSTGGVRRALVWYPPHQ